MGEEWVALWHCDFEPYVFSHFIITSLYFSLGFDMKEHYGEFGGDSAAYAAIVSTTTTARRGI